jgi:uncharacterized membrane protein
VSAPRLERTLGRVLGVGTLVGVGFLVAGVVAMAASNTGPLARPFPEFDLGRLASDLRRLQPAGFLWLGLAVVILTPCARVAASLVGFSLEGDRRMAAVALGILAVILASAVLGSGG